jgi:curved DNA-binding protein CbpA
LYDTLGVSKDAPKETIKRAYRKKALKQHPDHGGDEAKFKSLALAYRILSDEEKRARYDAGENPDAITNLATDEQKAQELLIKLYLATIEQGNVDLTHQDLIALMTATIQHNQREIRGKVTQLKNKRVRFETAIVRTKFEGGINILTSTAESAIKGINVQINTFEKECGIGDLTIEMLKNYSYDFVKAPPGFGSPYGGVFGI